MTLRQRQIKALDETLEQIKKEYEEGAEMHDWNINNCSLCKEFLYINNCSTECPFTQFSEFESKNWGCIYKVEKCFGRNPIRIEILAGLVYQIILYFEEDISEKTKG